MSSCRRETGVRAIFFVSGKDPDEEMVLTSNRYYHPLDIGGLCEA